ncbi:MAG: peptide-methionine (R)-S-oxide reductase [Pseudomonadota bacterium]
MTLRNTSRRKFIAGSTVAVAGLASAPAVRADGPFSKDFPFEIQRTKDEWRALLTDEEYNVLREGWTEPRHSSELINETRPGLYHCKGSDLAVYSHVNKVQLDIGWVFFRHSIPDSVMLGIDGPPPELNDAGMLRQDDESLVEVHCRRSGSHLGHMVVIKGEILHCINGIALEFVPDAA